MKIQNQSVKLNRKTAFTFKKQVAQTDILAAQSVTTIVSTGSSCC